jgi:hypothetical protein
MGEILTDLIIKRLGRGKNNQSESKTIPQQLEDLLTKYREFPLITDAISRVKDIVEHPEDYICTRTIGLTPETVPLTKEIEYNTPLSAASYLYDISPQKPQIENGFSEPRYFLQVFFKLCQPIQSPSPEDFEIDISIIKAPVNEEGKIVNMLAEQFSLKMKRRMGKSTLIPAIPQILTSEQKKELTTLIKSLPNLEPKEPYEIKWWAWTGNEIQVSKNNPSGDNQ